LAKNREYWHDVIGYNYRMTNICAAIGLAQLEQVNVFLGKKRQIARWYEERLKELPVIFHKEVGDVRHSFWMWSFLIGSPKKRDDLRKALLEAGIETRPLFYPVHTMPIYSKDDQEFPIAEDIASRGINMPSYPELEEKQVSYICKKVIGFFKIEK
jgi:perosamine synthetase